MRKRCAANKTSDSRFLKNSNAINDRKIAMEAKKKEELNTGAVEEKKKFTQAMVEQTEDVRGKISNSGISITQYIMEKSSKLQSFNCKCLNNAILESLMVQLIHVLKAQEEKKNGSDNLYSMKNQNTGDVEKEENNACKQASKWVPASKPSTLMEVTEDEHEITAALSPLSDNYVLELTASDSDLILSETETEIETEMEYLTARIHDAPRNRVVNFQATTESSSKKHDHSSNIKIKEKIEEKLKRKNSFGNVQREYNSLTSKIKREPYSGSSCLGDERDELGHCIEKCPKNDKLSQFDQSTPYIETSEQTKVVPESGEVEIGEKHEQGVEQCSKQETKSKDAIILDTSHDKLKSSLVLDNSISHMENPAESHTTPHKEPVPQSTSNKNEKTSTLLKPEGNELSVDLNSANMLDQDSQQSSVDTANPFAIQNKMRKEIEAADERLCNLSEKMSPQMAFDTVVKELPNISIEDLKDLKYGLCFKYKLCTNINCKYSHNARAFFKHKWNGMHPVRVMQFIGAMLYDHFFNDAALAACEVIIQQQISELWMKLLVLVVLRVNKPFDRPLFLFWSRVIGFFSSNGRVPGAAEGARKLLEIIVSAVSLDNNKIVEFFQVLKSPHLKANVTYQMLKLVGHLNLPQCYLLEAVQSCNRTKADVIEIYNEIVPLIQLQNLTAHGMETLLAFCQTLKVCDESRRSFNLKERLRLKAGILPPFKGQIDHKQSKARRYQPRLSAPPRSDRQCDLKLTRMDALPSENLFDSISPKRSRRDVVQNFVAPTSPCATFCEAIRERPVIEYKVVLPSPLEELKTQLKRLNFVYVGDALNVLKEGPLDVAEAILETIFNTTLEPERVLEFIKIIVLLCKTGTASSVIECVALNLMYLFVKKENWINAYLILIICDERHMDLTLGSILKRFSGNPLSQSRIALLLIEVYVKAGQFEKGLDLIEKYQLLQPNRSHWSLLNQESDGLIRIEVIEDIFQRLIKNGSTKLAHDFFIKVHKTQYQIQAPIDLRKFANEVMVLLLNEGNKAVFDVYKYIKREVRLKFDTIRGIIVLLVRNQRLDDAKQLLKLYWQHIYKLPDVNKEPMVLKINSYWLREEIFMMFDIYFDKLTRWKFIQNRTSITEVDRFIVNIDIQVLEYRNDSETTPLILHHTENSWVDMKNRIQSVLTTCMFPHLNVLIGSDTLFIDPSSLIGHLQHRFLFLKGVVDNEGNIRC